MEINLIGGFMFWITVINICILWETYGALRKLKAQKGEKMQDKDNK